MFDLSFWKNVDRFLDLLESDVPMSPNLFYEYNMPKVNDDPAGIYIVYDNGAASPKILYIGKADKRVNGKGVNNRVKEYVKTGSKILDSQNNSTVALGNHKGGRTLWKILNIKIIAIFELIYLR